jgi:hypothetical protein
MESGFVFASVCGGYHLTPIAETVSGKAAGTESGRVPLVRRQRNRDVLAGLLDWDRLGQWQGAGIL